MDTPALHPELQSFFDQHAAATAACKRAAHDSLAEILRVADQVEAHVAALTAKLTAAELAAHDHTIDPKLEWMHTRLKAASERAAAFRAAGRDLARTLVEVDRGFDADHRALVDRSMAAHVAGPAS